MLMSAESKRRLQSSEVLDPFDVIGLVCDVPVEDRRVVYDPRCRDWYVQAKSYPMNVMVSAYLSVDN